MKSLGFDRKENSYRFFLSENERDVSLSSGQRKNYYFYLVLFGKDGTPKTLSRSLPTPSTPNAKCLPALTL